MLSSSWNDPTQELSDMLKILWFGIQDSGGQPLLHKEKLAKLLRTSAGNCFSELAIEFEIILTAILLNPAGRRGDVSAAFEEFLNKAADPASDLHALDLGMLQDGVLGRYRPINPDTGELLEHARMLRDPEFIRRRAKQLAGFYDRNWHALISAIAVGICLWSNSGFAKFISEGTADKGRSKRGRKSQQRDFVRSHISGKEKQLDSASIRTWAVDTVKNAPKGLFNGIPPTKRKSKVGRMIRDIIKQEYGHYPVKPAKKKQEPK